MKLNKLVALSGDAIVDNFNAIFSTVCKRQCNFSLHSFHCHTFSLMALLARTACVCAHFIKIDRNTKQQHIIIAMMIIITVITFYNNNNRQLTIRWWWALSNNFIQCFDACIAYTYTPSTLIWGFINVCMRKTIVSHYLSRFSSCCRWLLLLVCCIYCFGKSQHHHSHHHRHRV